MNDKIQRNMNIRDHVDYVSRYHTNCIKINTNNSKDHEIKKARIAINLLFAEKTIFTECEHMELDRRSDIYVADDNLVIEIVNTEPKESIESKRKDFNEFNYDFECEDV